MNQPPTQTEIDARFICLDCHADTSKTGIREYYVVTPEIWAEAGLDIDDGMLCIGCLETRINRRLNPNDFVDCCANIDHNVSDRLLDRRQRDGNDDLRAGMTLVRAIANKDRYLDVIMREVVFYYGRRSVEVLHA